MRMSRVSRDGGRARGRRTTRRQSRTRRRGCLRPCASSPPRAASYSFIPHERLTRQRGALAARAWCRDRGGSSSASLSRHQQSDLTHVDCLIETSLVSTKTPPQGAPVRRHERHISQYLPKSPHISRTRASTRATPRAPPSPKKPPFVTHHNMDGPAAAACSTLSSVSSASPVSTW